MSGACCCRSARHGAQLGGAMPPLTSIALTASTPQCWRRNWRRWLSTRRLAVGYRSAWARPRCPLPHFGPIWGCRPLKARCSNRRLPKRTRGLVLASPLLLIELSGDSTGPPGRIRQRDSYASRCLLDRPERFGLVSCHVTAGCAETKAIEADSSLSAKELKKVAGVV